MFTRFGLFLWCFLSHEGCALLFPEFLSQRTASENVHKAMPENKYPWSEKIFLDTLLTRGMYGSNILSRIIGRGGVHHRRMESESGARVFFRGLGVSGRDMELVEPIDCRLHISVKGEVPLQGQVVRLVILLVSYRTVVLLCA